MGEEVECHSVRAFEFYPDFAHTTHEQVEILCVDKGNALYPDDPTVQKLAVLDLDMGNISGGMRRKIRIEVGFGYTELYVVARCKGKEVKTQLDFLID